jgi:UDP-3-O-[3-hydroxymyristoyl] glucosamine N-acyltransferase
MSISLQQIAELVGGQVTGSPDLHVTGAASISRATAGQLTFVTSPQHWQQFLASTAAAAIVSGVEVTGNELSPAKPCIVVTDAEAAFAKVVTHFCPPVRRPRIGVSPEAHISPSAVIETDVDIYPGAFIGAGTVISRGSRIYPGVCILENCRIGRDVTIFPNAVLYENTIVGDGTIIHAGVVLGAHGFGYRSRNGRHELSPQLGYVKLGSQVEIGANSTVDRGTFEATTIGDGSKLDDQVMIGHNCQIGRHNLLCSQVGIAGSSSTGDYVVMAGQVGIGDHIQIGEKTTLCAKAGIMNDVPAGEVYLGIPATPIREQMQIMACISKLPEIRSQVRSLGKQLAAAQAAVESPGIEQSRPENKAA